MGSDFFVDHPLVPLKRIKFLANVDIMGDATDGVTVVNATEYPEQFELLNSINTKNNYLPAIKSRGKAANSDHYHFSEAGVPAFFIYSNGGKGYYHDIYDKPEAITLNNIDGVVKLLKDFVAAIQ
jgi:aminopeptidase YwaD